MATTRRFDLINALGTAVLATAATTALAAVLGARRGKPAKVINSTSHIVWGDKDAFRASKPDLKHTLVGAALNAAAMGSWAVVQQGMFGKSSRGTFGKALAAGAVTSALAYVTDYYLVPKRFTPGFEKHLGSGEMLGMYGVLAGALALGMGLGKRES